jgi:iron only hydrogenase large subunit-like protein
MASVFLGDLNDFIAPSQACVNPLFAAPKDTGAADGSSASGANSAGVMELVLEDEEAWSTNVSAPPLQEPDLIKSTAGQTATVTLNDCLACSGCVTSAETVLISQQSTAKLLEALRSGTHSISVVSLSPQSRASLADHFGASLLETQARVTTLLQALGVTHVIDASCAGDLCLVAARDELIGRIKASQNSSTSGSSSNSSTITAAAEPPPWRAPAHTVAVSRAVQTELATGLTQAVPLPRSDAPLPLLISACPGWVCYAEKTTPEAIPYMSAVKSPQQVLGALLKGAGARAWGVSAQQVLHVSVQPCFDRKLEASRLDFWDAAADSSEVDLVLSTAELLELIVQQCRGSEAQVQRVAVVVL